MINFGEVPAGAVLPIPFAAYAATTGASVTLTGLAVTDIEVYKGTSMTQRASDNGYALMDTDGIDLDGITGIHGFSIDTGDNSDSGFYAVGSYFTVIVSAVTIDGQTVNFIAATFRLKAAETAAGVPKADVSHYGGSAGTFSGGRPEVNTTHAAGTAWNSGAIGASTLAADTITAAKVAADVTTELQSGLATASAVSTLTGYVDTEIADIQSRLPAALVGGRMACDVIAISGDTVAADNLENAFDDTAGAVPWQGIIDQGTAQAATSTSLQLRAAATFANDEIIGAVIVITGGSAGVGQSRTITDYVASTDTATVDAWTTTPSGTITYKVLAGPPPDATATSIKTVTDKLDDVLEDSGGGAWIFTAAALANADSSGVLAKIDNTLTNTSDGYVFSGPALQAVWDEPIAGHLVSGSTGSALNAAGSSGDPWATTLPGAYGPGTAGYKLATVDGTVAKLDTMLEATSDAYTFTPDALQFAPTGGGGGLDAAGVRAAVGLASANLDTQLSGIQSDTNDIQTRIPAALVSGRIDASVGAMAADTLTASALASDATAEIQSGLATAAALATVDTVVDAIQAKTDNLPADPADASDIAGSFSTVNSTLGTIAGYLDTEIAAIKAKTDNLPASPAATSDIPSVGAIADAVWDEAVSGHTSSGTFGKALDDADDRGARTVVRGTAAGSSTTTSILTSAFSPAGGAADQFKGRIVIFDNDTATAELRGQATDITASSNSATPTLTVTALTTAPASGDTFSVL